MSIALQLIKISCHNTKKSDAKARKSRKKASERKTAIEAMNDSTTEEQQTAKTKWIKQ